MIFFYLNTCTIFFYLSTCTFNQSSGFMNLYYKITDSLFESVVIVAF